jgi:hypothetical protein
MNASRTARSSSPPPGLLDDGTQLGWIRRLPEAGSVLTDLVVREKALVAEQKALRSLQRQLAKDLKSIREKALLMVSRNWTTEDIQTAKDGAS